MPVAKHRMVKKISSQSPPGDRRSPPLTKRVSLLALTFIFSLCSVGIMEDFQDAIWLKTYLLIATLLWGNLLIYLSIYPRWSQWLIGLKKADHKKRVINEDNSRINKSNSNEI